MRPTATPPAVFAFSYVVTKDGFVIYADIHSGLYVLKYKGPYKHEIPGEGICLSGNPGAITPGYEPCEPYGKWDDPRNSWTQFPGSRQDRSLPCLPQPLAPPGAGRIDEVALINRRSLRVIARGGTTKTRRSRHAHVEGQPADDGPLDADLPAFTLAGCSSSTSATGSPPLGRSIAFYEALGLEKRRELPIRDEAINYFLGVPAEALRELELTHTFSVDSYELGTLRPASH
jgi:hypothetical protein